MPENNDIPATAPNELQQIAALSAASPASAMVNYVAADAIGKMMYNAVSAQQNAQILASASVAATCARILSASRTVQPHAPAPAPQAAGTDEAQVTGGSKE